MAVPLTTRVMEIILFKYAFTLIPLYWERSPGIRVLRIALLYHVTRQTPFRQALRLRLITDSFIMRHPCQDTGMEQRILFFRIISFSRDKRRLQIPWRDAFGRALSIHGMYNSLKQTKQRYTSICMHLRRGLQRNLTRPSIRESKKR